MIKWGRNKKRLGIEMGVFRMEEEIEKGEEKEKMRA